MTERGRGNLKGSFQNVRSRSGRQNSRVTDKTSAESGESAELVELEETAESVDNVATVESVETPSAPGAPDLDGQSRGASGSGSSKVPGPGTTANSDAGASGGRVGNLDPNTAVGERGPTNKEKRGKRQRPAEYVQANGLVRREVIRRLELAKLDPDALRALEENLSQSGVEYKPGDPDFGGICEMLLHRWLEDQGYVRSGT